MTGTVLPPMVAAVERARTARLLVAIPFHHDAARLEFLGDVLRTLAEFPVAQMQVAIATNTAEPSALERLGRLGDELFPPGGCAVAAFPSLEHPLDLTWTHKQLLAQTWRDDPQAFTHFVYLEADIRFTFQNFCYWLEARETLRPHGLLPAYVRVEYHRAMLAFTSSDSFWQVHVPFQAHLERDGRLFLNLSNPYNAHYVLDSDLVAEYVASESFGIETSRSVCTWGKPERAAMGLCLERVPDGFASRYVVPVLPGNRVPTAAWVSHLTGNYANTPRSPLGKIRMADLVHGAVAERGRPNPWRAAEALLMQLRDLDVDRLFYLVTDHDTVVFYDRTERALKHAPFGIAPLDTCAELRGQQVRLWSGPPGDPMPPGGDAPDGAAPHATTRLEFETQYFLDGTIALVADGLFVGADLDGQARHNRQRCLQWERFRLVRLDTLAGLSLLRRHRWRGSDPGAAAHSLADQPLWLHYPHRDRPSEASALAATLAPGALQHRQGLAFGPARVQIIGSEPVIRGPEGRAPAWPAPDTLEARSLDGTWHAFARVDAPAADGDSPEAEDPAAPGGP